MKDKSTLRKIKHILMNILWPLQLLKYLISKDKFNNICKELNIEYLDDIETVNQIVNEKKSLTRFGDGELLWMIGEDFKSYQKGSELLSKRLKEVLLSNESNLLIGIPSVYNKKLLMRYNLKSRVHWVNFNVKHLSKYQQFYSKKVYADAQISRCYIDYRYKLFTKEKYSNLRRIWEKRDVIIVEGEKSKVGLGNDLLSNANSIKRIICPAFDAFEKYDEILEKVKEHCANKITILALGPTATVLAYDIARLNEKNNKHFYQAIDLGHFDIEYEWYLSGTSKRIPVKGKFVNEVANKELDIKIGDDDRVYEESILCKIV